MNFPRKYLAADEIEAYTRRSQFGPCFVCQIVRGESDYKHHMIHEDDQAIVFLNKNQPLYGYTLVAPRQHLEHVIADLTADDYLSLQRLIHAVGKAVQRAVPTERLYVFSLGSQQGNRHVHWHIAPLPPGVPYDRQQLAALDHAAGVLDMSEENKAELAQRIAAELAREPGHQPASRPSHRIRPLAICVVKNGDRILVEHGFDSVKGQQFYRPLGGAIEFGERAIDAVRREFQEELNAELGELRLRGVLENLFKYEGAAGHEIVFVFDGQFRDARLNDEAEFTVREPPSAGRATWVTLDELSAGSRPLYPDGLIALLTDLPQGR